MKFQVHIGFTFVTYLERDEVYGWLEDSCGTIISGSGGWWRTNNEREAAEKANDLIKAGLYPKSTSNRSQHG